MTLLRHVCVGKWTGGATHRLRRALQAIKTDSCHDVNFVASIPMTTSFFLSWPGCFQMYIIYNRFEFQPTYGEYAFWYVINDFARLTVLLLQATRQSKLSAISLQCLDWQIRRRMPCRQLMPCVPLTVCHPLSCSFTAVGGSGEVAVPGFTTSRMPTPTFPRPSTLTGASFMAMWAMHWPPEGCPVPLCPIPRSRWPSLCVYWPSWTRLWWRWRSVVGSSSLPSPSSILSRALHLPPPSSSPWYLPARASHGRPFATSGVVTGSFHGYGISSSLLPLLGHFWIHVSRQQPHVSSVSCWSRAPSRGCRWADVLATLWRTSSVRWPQPCVISEHVVRGHGNGTPIVCMPWDTPPGPIWSRLSHSETLVMVWTLHH